MTHDGLLPIDVAGKTPSLQCIDTFISHYQALNKIDVPRSRASERNARVAEIIDSQQKYLPREQQRYNKRAPNRLY